MAGGPDDRLDFRPHEKVNTIRTILVHQLLSERRFFAQFVGTAEPPVEDLLPAGETPAVAAYIEKYVWLTQRRLPQFAAGTSAWWVEERPFFGGLVRERIWVFWRRSCTPAITARRCKVGCGWPGATSRPSTGRPAT